MMTEKIDKLLELLTHEKHFRVRLFWEGIAVGIASGLSVGLFRYLLSASEELRPFIYNKVQQAWAMGQWQWPCLYAAAFICIAKIEEKENFVVEMDKYIAEKCEYGDSMETLNAEQRILYITQALEMEVNNGGFAQFFFNSDGCLGNEIVSSFEKIGAMKTAEICKKAISIYGDKVPNDRDEREEILTPDDEKEEERIEAILNECDDAFFEYEEDLVELNYQFIINHKESFLK